MDLMGTLGLADVVDPDNLPDNKYAGVVYKCEYMISKTDKLGIAVTYKVDDPQSKFHGREKFDWTTIGEGASKTPEGEFTCAKVTMSDSQKPYFKKRMADLGIPESRLSNLTNADLNSRVGTKVFFGIKNKDGYNNVNYVEMRGEQSNPMEPTQGENPWATPTSTPATPAASGGGNLADQI